MRLYLSSSSPLNSTYTSAEGQALFKVQTPSRIFSRTTTISRAVSGYLPCSSRRDHSMRDRFGQVAHFEWKSFRSSRLRFRGQEVRTKTFFKKQDWGWHGRHRVFPGPDGREYKWMLNSTTPELRLNTGLKNVVARYHPARSTLFCKPRRACLEIFPGGERIVDTVLVTFIYIEKLREDE